MNPFRPSKSTLVKLGSIAVHADEAISNKAHQFDFIVIKQLLEDPEITKWMDEMNKMALLPQKRNPMKGGEG